VKDKTLSGKLVPKRNPMPAERGEMVMVPKANGLKGTRKKAASGLGETKGGGSSSGPNWDKKGRDWGKEGPQRKCIATVISRNERNSEGPNRRLVGGEGKKRKSVNHVARRQKTRTELKQELLT